MYLTLMLKTVLAVLYFPINSLLIVLIESFKLCLSVTFTMTVSIET